MNGKTMNGKTMNGKTMNGKTMNGKTMNGKTMNGKTMNGKTMNGLLKTELGFNGFVVYDWDGQHAGVATALAGLDVVMPG
jgi:beta-glucosidase-like glycosyl hydrolase